jgi:TRAP-type C4-dicarboxylate transport system substrate-binding protein
MIKRRHHLLAGAMALATLGGSLWLGGGAAAETFKLTAIGGPPPVALSVKVTKEFFLPEVNKRLAAAGSPHRIEWTEAWSGSVAKLPEVFSAVQNNVGDLGVQVWPFEGSKLPLENITFHVPFGTSDPIQLVEIFRTLRRKVPEMDTIYQKYNQVHLASWALDPDQLISKMPIKKLDDLKGRKIGASGTMAQYFSNTGAVPVSSSMDQAVTAIESGVYDGYPAPITLMFPYRMHNSAKYVTQVNFGATVASGITINKRVFDRLPKDVQDVMRAVGWDTAVLHSRQASSLAVAFRDRMAKDGVTFIEFSAEERKRWAQSLPNIAKAWASRLDSQGLPGTKLLQTYMDELRSLPNSREFLVREWDKTN